MSKRDGDALVEQIRCLLLGRKIPDELKVESEDLADVQDAILYLQDRLSETYLFIKELAAGNLDVEPPDNRSFWMGSLKELHAGLKHLAWQTRQVADGDYHQRVHFLGDFSDSFNEMTRRLSEREFQLKKQSAMMEETISFMRSVMDRMDNMIIVMARGTGEVIYANQSARRNCYDVEGHKYVCGIDCGLIDCLKAHERKADGQLSFSYECPLTHKTLHIKTFLIQWKDRLAYVHYIEDITDNKEYREQMEELAYRDELTGLYNRRYCIAKLDELIEQEERFSCCLADANGLKLVNDNFGHGEGDKYLIAIAEIMKKTTRATDTLCRIGGDEFVFLFPDCKEQTVLEKMNLLNQKLDELSKDYQMSVSYGVMYVDGSDGISLEAIMAEADEKMYEMKIERKRGKYRR